MAPAMIFARADCGKTFSVSKGQYARPEGDYRGYNRALIMPLAPGTRFGPYEISAPLGAGGMGEVYRALDTRLERTVAIKILPERLSSDPVRKQRFEREAKTVSSLNHPHICVLHDIGSQDGISYLVMECVEGETLAKRLEKGALALEQVLKYGMQVADALDKAHRSGVVHRDLKPGNIMLTPSGAKLLDFGLAKPAAPLATAATLTAAKPNSPITEEGTIVGTFHYMSPEQVEGKELDGRSDIFSLGAVLYEMLTGKRAFDGKSQLSVASAILEKAPTPVTVSKPMTPPALDHAIRRCLGKDPDERWQSASDLKGELLWISQSSGEAAIPQLTVKGRTRGRAVLLAGGAAALLVAATVIATYSFSHRRSAVPTVRSVILPPPNVTLLTLGDEAGPPAISRDGSNLVFVGTSEGRQMLFLRPLNSATAKPVLGTEGGKFPFWSSDGKSIGFFSDQQLKRVDLAGGPPTSLASAPDARGGTWAGDMILFAPNIYDVIHRVPASGGKPIPVTALDRSQYTTHRWPQFLPDGKHFLYLAAQHMGGKEADSAIFAGSIDGSKSKLILPTKASALHSSGNLLFFRDGSLMAQEFDADRLELRGEATAIGQVLRESGNWAMIAAASENGVLIFQSGGELKYPVLWFDRSGRALGPAPVSGQLQDLRLSFDRTQAATVGYEGRPTPDVYVYDLKTAAQRRLTFGESAWFVVWSPDETRLAYSVGKGETEKTDLYLKRSDGASDRELLLSSGYIDHPTDWTRDGRYVVINRGSLGSQRIWILPMFGDRKAFPLFPNVTYDHFEGRVSPDGKWIAYVSAESGRSEVYVTSFPAGVGKWQVSSGGIIPVALWRPDGKELYFVTEAGNLMAASVRESAGSMAVEGLRTLFRSPFLTGRVHTIFDVGPDGQRFIGTPAPDTSTLPLNVVTSWAEELRKK
jgi:eukaryotic-like serine/threonine-protein kinase